MAGLLTRPGPDPVASELALWAATDFRWGETDCCQSILIYIERCSGRRLEPWPRASNAFRAQLIIERAGCLVALCQARFGELGCPKTDAPARGDFGVIDLPGSGHTLCLCLGHRRWAARCDTGVVIFCGVALASWRLPCPRH
ncbi:MULTISPECIES: hypothetical protein [unclassified Novosphingobium]|uniref:DUF6950 family protein n=1 Tax=unclassified Novosphingobium TaxID=2644732 RepID=UPI000D3443AD|nr:MULTISPECIES: hypothetical protein [unclassified Novosphingobium]PTR11754.1 hypothetical protein C8K11_104113 [Novosphingobium sp. GV055]PUB04794.1 hypothetical protein C8K12_104113 [Novosphingobium sp. GV061]PUB21113.1 hypothetical protein C8K14_104113 [Novosphingobium sp. GV079]PUB42839.1 hypothetical protein C8K10_104113 [Novosphingobium sp. GV027]